LKRLIRGKRIVVNDSELQSQDANPGPEKYAKSPRRANTVEDKRLSQFGRATPPRLSCSGELYNYSGDMLCPAIVSSENSSIYYTKIKFLPHREQSVSTRKIKCCVGNIVA
jgi:hypothetical protein